jgi:hypothetical protein
MQIGAPTSKSVRLGEAAAWPGGTQAVRVGSLGAGHSRTNNQTRGAWGSLDPAGPMLPPLAGSARTAAESAQTKRGTIITSCSWQAQLRHKLKQQQPNRQRDGSVASLVCKRGRAARLLDARAAHQRQPKGCALGHQLQTVHAERRCIAKLPSQPTKGQPALTATAQRDE